MKRRQFIAGLGSAAAVWPVVMRAQQLTMPIVGYLYPATESAAPFLTTAFRQGLGEQGYVEGRNVAIEYRWALDKAETLPGLAADLVRRRVAVIATPGSNAAAVAAKAATSIIPIVFSIGGDPVKLGLVASLNRPGGNVTGVSFLATDIAAKTLEVLHQPAPNTSVIAALVNPANPTSEADSSEAQRAARILGLELHVFNAATAREIETAFATLVQQRAGALLIEGDPLFQAHFKELVALTVAHAIPAIFPGRPFPDAGGLMSYGANLRDAARINGVYVGRILNGEKPADLPVQQSTKVELIINKKTAKAIGLTIPERLLATADEVIQ